MIAGALSDLRHAVRVYRKTPWQSALAVIMLAAAMALVSAMASLWSDLHLSGTPGVEDDRGLASVTMRGDMPRGVLSAEAVADLKAQSQTFDSISGVSMFSWPGDIEIEGEPFEGLVEPVLPDYFETVRPRMLLGRGLEADDFIDDGAHVLVIGHAFWQRQFDGDPSIIGREVELADEHWRVVGVIDSGFQGMSPTEPALWIPYRRFYADIQTNIPLERIDQFPFWRIVGRLASGLSTDAAEAELRRFVADHDFPPPSRAPDPDRFMVIDGMSAHPEARENARRQTSLLLAAAFLVAVVAAVNIGIFLLARAPARRRELALRQTVGAGRRRLAGQLLIEAAVLVVMATVTGIVLSIWLAAGIREMAFLDNAGFSDPILNWQALAFSATLAGVFTVLVALVPIALTRTRRLSQESRQISARPGLFQHAAGLVQLSLAGLVGAAALGFLGHMWMMSQKDLGLEPEHVQVAGVTFKEQPTGQVNLPGPEVVHSYREDVRERLGALPGVEAVSFGMPVPGQRLRSFGGFDIDGERIEPRMISIAPDFMRVLGIPLLRGNEPAADDTMGVVINREFAEQAWGTIDVIDRFIVDADGEEPDERWRVIGVVENVAYAHPDEPAEPLLFSATTGMMAGIMAAVLVKGEASPDLIGQRIEEALSRHSEMLHVNRVGPLRELLGELTAADRARTSITGLFGIVILLMAGFGFFAMQRFLVDAGMRETAIRMALGAGPRLIRRHVLTQGLKLGLPGLVIGSLLAIITAAWLTDDLITSEISVPVISAVMAFVLATLMLLASLQPALRAGRLKPGDLLKEE